LSFPYVGAQGGRKGRGWADQGRGGAAAGLLAPACTQTRSAPGARPTEPSSHLPSQQLSSRSARILSDRFDPARLPPPSRRRSLPLRPHSYPSTCRPTLCPSVPSRPATRGLIGRSCFPPLPVFAMSSSGKVRAHELVSKNKADLTKQLGELKQELLSLRVQKVAGGSAAKLTKMCVSLAGVVAPVECGMRRGLSLADCRRARAAERTADRPSPFRPNSNTVRKSIARVLTVINQKQRANLREFYKNSKCASLPRPESSSTLAQVADRSSPARPLAPPTDIPLDLRHKKTRAIRRRLTAGEKNAVTERQHKKNIHFPTRSAFRRDSAWRLPTRSRSLTTCLPYRVRCQGLNQSLAQRRSSLPRFLHVRHARAGGGARGKATASGTPTDVCASHAMHAIGKTKRQAAASGRACGGLAVRWTGSMGCWIGLTSCGSSLAAHAPSADEPCARPQRLQLARQLQSAVGSQRHLDTPRRFEDVHRLQLT